VRRAALTLAAILLLGACGGGSGASAPTEVDGAELFLRRCAACHGIEGEGNVGPGFAGVADRLTPEEHASVIRQGRVGTIGQMPAFADLTDEEVAALVEYERSLSG
jgi:mono/diheme cytochrome c family protein